MIVVVVIPVTIRAPAMAVLVPPALVVLPTPRASVSQFLAPMPSVGTVPAMMFRCFVQFMIGLDDAFLTMVCDELSHRFNIAHATLQIEAGNDVCRLAPSEVV